MSNAVCPDHNNIREEVIKLKEQTKNQAEDIKESKRKIDDIQKITHKIDKEMSELFIKGIKASVGIGTSIAVILTFVLHVIFGG